MVRRLVPLLALLVLLAWSAPAGAQRPAPAVIEESGATVVRVVADRRKSGPRVSRSFLGLSQEHSLLHRWMGYPGTPRNNALVALFDQIRRRGLDAPTLRIGGGSTDYSWFDAEGRVSLPEIYFAVTPAWLDQLRDLLAASGARTIFGVNLGLGRPEVTAEMIASAVRHLGRGPISAFEVGNEPDIYNMTELRQADGSDRLRRPRDYGPDDYLAEVHRVYPQLDGARGGVPLAGPGSSPFPEWVQMLKPFASRERNRVKTLTVHEYPLSRCHVKPDDPRFPTAADLLGRSGWLPAAVRMHAIVRLARRHRMKVRVSETNSVTCGGAPGASDVYASALWGLDWMLQFASVGVEGVNFHGSSPTYAPVIFGYDGARWRAAVAPLWYAFLAFAETVPHGSRMLPSAYATARVARGTAIRPWAAYDPVDRVVRVMVVFKTGRRSGTAVVRVPGARGSGTVKRLDGHSFRSKAGITWGGQYFPRVTTDAEMLGRPKLQRVRRRAKGTFRFRVEPGTAALLTVPVGR